MLRGRFEKLSQIFDGFDGDIQLPLEELITGGEGRKKSDGEAAALLRERTERLRSAGSGLVIAELPAVIWPSDMRLVRNELELVRNAGITDVLAENAGAIELAREYGFTIHGGFCLNVLNSVAFDEYRSMGLKDVTLSFEMDFAHMRQINGEGKGAVVYGRLPLMKFRSCPAQGKNGCAGCTGINTLKDRKGESFIIICRNKRYSELLNCVPLYLGDKRVPELDFETLYFTVESRGECAEITRKYRDGAEPDFRRTAGLYFRELL